MFRLIKDNFPYASFHVRPPRSQYEPGKKRSIIHAGVANLQIHPRPPSHVHWLYGGFNEPAEKLTFLKTTSSAGSSQVVLRLFLQPQRSR
jgi:hypothetical protein